MKLIVLALVFGFALQAQLNCVAAQQTGKIPRVGFLRGPGPDESDVQVFLQGLNELSWVEGKNITLEHRWGKSEQYSTLVTELVDLKVDVIVVDGTGSALAAKKVTSAIPIVMTTSTDPVGTGLDSCGRRRNHGDPR